ncbi:NifB/NifX family molybdenum-iron cluster-binding protein [Sulfurovum sp.]|jgi:nitrogen fixation protein NifX|uniref:NifB/NifX family molybdenum-iron cluster-binding protein n=1 Tax=Sulfurovum sp. TaxID=1969726 RepID=UPI002A360C78|nr:NifB/NifX family molybdenum-iron cluster-binding protein [Sulfurovum sp.]MDD2452153.1 NifB/NifX family molybdenum-iron cluster-binding protein [Sulfurovum sp.]MDY0403698.1 NifB/NifX family molybdenum-iron cluster-binding protein [Sulfurovum sp.]
MIIAFASSTGEKIDQHFGWSKYFYLYRIDQAGAEFFKTVNAETDIEDEHEKLNCKIEAIGEADIMYCTQIGPKASQMVQAAGIHPVRAAEGEALKDAIGNVIEMLNTKPPIWLLRAFHKARQRSA